MDGSVPSDPRGGTLAGFRVALVTPAYGSLSSGLERHVRELARGIVRAGGRAEVLTEVPSSPGSVLAEDDGVVVHGFRPASGTQGYAMNRELWSWLAVHAAGFDIVHAHGLRTLPVLRSARIEPRRVVFTPHWHRSEAGRFGRVVQPMSRRLGAPAIERAARIICASDAEAAAVRRLAPAVAERIRVVPDGADGAAIAAAGPHPDAGSPIVAVGRVEPGALLHRLVSALLDLPDEHVLAVIGDGSGRRALRAHVAASGLGGRVRLLGPLDGAERHGWLRAASVAVVLGPGPAPAALSEALAAGVPTVATALPEHLEAIEHNPGAVEVQLVDPEASPLRIADALRRAIELGPVAPVPVATWTDVADRSVAVYRELLGAARV